MALREVDVVEGLVAFGAHLDDLALSAGEFLASWPGAYALSLFCGHPDPVQTSSFDHHSGFADSTEAMVKRAHEDDRAARALGVRPLRAAFLDAQYRDGVVGNPMPSVIAELVIRCAETADAIRIVGPLGLAHPDHEVCADALRIVAHERPRWRVHCYEDLPSRVTDPELVGPALARIGADPTTTFLGAGLVEMKERAIRCYRSQSWALNARVLTVPERYHMIVP